MRLTDTVRDDLSRILTDVSVRYERSRSQQEFEDALNTAIDEIHILLTIPQAADDDASVERVAKAAYEANADYSEMDFMEWGRLGEDKAAWLHMAHAAVAAMPDAGGLDALLSELSPREWINVQGSTKGFVAVVQMPGSLGRRNHCVFGTGATRPEALASALEKASKERE